MEKTPGLGFLWLTALRMWWVSKLPELVVNKELYIQFAAKSVLVVDKNYDTSCIDIIVIKDKLCSEVFSDLESLSNRFV